MDYPKSWAKHAHVGIVLDLLIFLKACKHNISSSDRKIFKHKKDEKKNGV